MLVYVQLLQVSLEEFRIRTAQMYRQYGKMPESGSDRSPLHLGVGSGSAAPPSDKSGQLAIDSEVKKQEPSAASSEHSEAVNDQAKHHNKGEKDTSKVENNIEISADGSVSNVLEDAVIMVPSEDSIKETGKRTEVTIVEQKPEGHTLSKEQIQLTPTTKPLANDGAPGQRQAFSPTPRAPAFTIPEFRWSALHVKLLADLFSFFEKEMEGWKM